MICCEITHVYLLLSIYSFIVIFTRNTSPYFVHHVVCRCIYDSRLKWLSKCEDLPIGVNYLARLIII